MNFLIFDAVVFANFPVHVLLAKSPQGGSFDSDLLVRLSYFIMSTLRSFVLIGQLSNFIYCVLKNEYLLLAIVLLKTVSAQVQHSAYLR